MDNQVEVEITGLVVTSQYGTLSTGTVLRTNAAFAKHLVEDCSAAKYRTVKDGDAAPKAAVQKKATPKKAKGAG